MGAVRHTKGGAIPHRLKAALKERGLTAIDLATFFGVTEDRALGWMDHTNRFPPLWKLQLRDNFLNMGIDEFIPITEELRSVQRDEKRYKAEWYQENNKGGKHKVRRAKYTRRFSIFIQPEIYNAFLKLAGYERKKQAEAFRMLIGYEIRKNADRIAVMKKLLRRDIDDWRSETVEARKGAIYVNFMMDPEMFREACYLTLANGMPMARTIRLAVLEYLEKFDTRRERP